jgi:hypothetical protein
MEVIPPEELINAYFDGELDEAGGERLNAWLAADEANVRAFARRAFVHHQIREHMLVENVNQALRLNADIDDETLLAESPMQGRRGSSGSRASRLALMAAAMAGVLVGGFTTWRVSANKHKALRDEVVSRSPAGRDAVSYVATLTSATNCRWDTARSTANVEMGSTLRPGESLHLLEGVARIQTLASGAETTFQLEGPAAMTLTSDGMPSLLYGKLTASFSSRFDQFALGTPLGRVIVSSNASIGVTSTPNQVELHVFSGAATLELWARGLKDASTLTAKAGASIRAQVSSDGDVTVSRGGARENGFVTPAALAKSRLSISADYVKMIRDADPLAYWRFERPDGGLMRNEVDDRLHCRMVGDAVRWRPNAANASSEFGVTAGPGYLISEDTVDIDGDYTLEAWVKPTYFHHGALFSLIDWTPSRSPLGSHRLHLELCGPLSGFAEPYRPTEFNPGRVRLIHQNSECFSSAPYAVRRWQHLAAVKQGENMRLYADGKLVAAYEDQRAVGRGLHVLMGQLFPQSPFIDDQVTSRLFVGEMDEVALYSHALSESEFQERVEMAVHEIPAEAATNSGNTY